MQAHENTPEPRAVAYRDDRGKWVMCWPAGYAYDFWTDQTAAERAARVTTRLLQTGEAADRAWIDESLKRRGLLVRARVKHPLDSWRGV